MNNISLYYFIAVAEELNITRAAARLYITQQSLSEHIRKLERSYGTLFFERSPRLRLTLQGERMLAYARTVVAAEQALTEQLQEDADSGRTRLSIGLGSSRGAVFLPSIIENYHRAWPNVLLTILSGSPSQLESMLRKGRIELYFAMRDSAGGKEQGETLYRDKLYFIISRSLLARVFPERAAEFIEHHMEGIRLAEACGFPLALPPAESTLRSVFDRMLSAGNLRASIVLETIEHEILFDVCKSGLCACFVSRELLYRKIMHRNLPADMLFFPLLELEELSCVDLVSGGQLSPWGRSFIQCSLDTVRAAIAEIDDYLRTAANR